jgi:hypothetical protein
MQSYTQVSSGGVLGLPPPVKLPRCASTKTRATHACGWQKGGPIVKLLLHGLCGTNPSQGLCGANPFWRTVCVVQTPLDTV